MEKRGDEIRCRYLILLTLGSFQDSPSLTVISWDKIRCLVALPFHNNSILIVVVVFPVNVRDYQHRFMLSPADRNLVVQDARFPCSRTRFLTALILTSATNRT